MAFTRVVGPGIHTASNINSHNINSTGIITAVSFVGDGSGLTGINTDFIVGTAITMGTANFTGNVTIGGTLTYEDVKNIDSVGIITARSDLNVDGHTNLDNVSIAGVTTYDANVKLNTNKRLYFGSNSYMYYESSGSTFYETTGGYFIQRYKVPGGGHEHMFEARPNNSVLLFFNGSEKLKTTTKGIQVGTGVTIETNGQATYTGIITATAFKLADGSAIGAGAGGTWSTYTAGIATSKSVGVNTSNLDDNDLVGVGNSFQGLYISNGMMITDNKLSGNHYIGTAFNGLMAGPVNIEGTLTIDGNYVVV